ncbi:Inorganic phosphate transporter 1-11 [Vitis vinifera]|uniref:Inorganic phosphate transporter 1-11 n=1 Tax=Vitis vinifera TaxID=29760 RepID=A0A438ICV0_VITVI|nr:Inorganic phosphate transporter 1-11 [Vitis vinifera]
MSDGLAVLHALDSARTQWYHITAIVIAGMGFFTDAYDLFCISTVSKLLGRLYYYDPATGKPGKLPHGVNNFVVGVALVGTLSGQLVFGWLGDKLGRKKVYGMTLILMSICAICSGLSFGFSNKSVITTLCFFRFWLGFGIGAVFAMQGVGIVFAGLVSMILSKLFLLKYETVAFDDNPILSTQPEADYLWRIVLMLGALPALLTYYWRMKMPETGRYTALIEGNAKQAAADMGRVLEIEIQAEADKVAEFKAANEYSLWSREFFNRHGRHLIGTMSTWFLLDIAFYSQNLTQKDIFPAMKLVSQDHEVSALREMFETSRAMFVVALLGTFPGYWFTVFFIDRIGRYIIQLVGPIWADLLLRQFRSKQHNFCSSGRAVPDPSEINMPCTERCGREGWAMIGAFVVSTYTLDGKAKEIRIAMITMSCTNMLGFFCTFLVTETKGRSLEEISGEDGGINETQMASRPS